MSFGQKRQSLDNIPESGLCPNNSCISVFIHAEHNYILMEEEESGQEKDLNGVSLETSLDENGRLAMLFRVL
jgi:hypothetical protein